MKIIKCIQKRILEERALGLVEVLVSLAIVGTGMVIITSVSLKTIKQARKNELQDVANQIAVEALDFMKIPMDIDADVVSDGYYELDFDSTPYLISDVSGSELDPAVSSCTPNHSYYIDLGTAGYVVCRQIYIQTVSPGRYDFKVIILWETVGQEESEKAIFEGHRIGDII